MHPGSPATHRSRRMFRLVLLTTVLLGLAGCGQKGDLYLPPEPQDAQLTPTDQASITP
ncbi:LPS translocon maturation chaperone LptM [Saccharospirillum salsuginis]|nr:lipoprotein [Saccharospirillum salsuginis]